MIYNCVKFYNIRWNIEAVTCMELFPNLWKNFHTRYSFNVPLYFIKLDTVIDLTFFMKIIITNFSGESLCNLSNMFHIIKHTLNAINWLRIFSKEKIPLGRRSSATSLFYSGTIAFVQKAFRIRYLKISERNFKLRRWSNMFWKEVWWSDRASW